MSNTLFPKVVFKNGKENQSLAENLPEILLISSYPPRECGIATFSQDLLTALQNKFAQSFSVSVCALEVAGEKHEYPPVVRYVLDTSDHQGYQAVIDAINADNRIKIVLLQHEFGFFETIDEYDFLHFINSIKKPLILTFHTVLSKPSDALKKKVKNIILACDSIVIMTKNSAEILEKQYDVPAEKTWVIAHGIHLVPHLGKTLLKKKYGLSGRKVLSTFGLISSGKSIETTLDALPGIVVDHPSVIFLIIGKTHPSVVKHEGEQYRRMLEAKVATLSLENHVKFINAYLPLQELLEYLQMTDIYLFTSKDPHQAVSGTFSYAVSCACAIISTPIPHARELLRDDAGILIDFQSSPQLTAAVNRLLDDSPLRKRLINNGLQRVIFAAWENTAIAHAMLFKNLAPDDIALRYGLPEIHLEHVKRMTTNFGMIQFSKINHPDPDSGYTIDDNARAMVAVCMHHEIFNDKKDLVYIRTYLNFIEHCLQPDGHFLNYADIEKAFTAQNKEVNLDDANGRTIWALGFLISKQDTLPKHLVHQAKAILEQTFRHIETIHSPRAMAFAIKGLHYHLSAMPSPQAQRLVETLANRLAQMYRHEAESGWHWFESYLTYGNSILPEAMLCAWLSTGNYIYRDIAHESFDFLIQHTFTEAGIKVVPNSGWMQKGQKRAQYGEQPIDVAYTILALQLFYEVFNDEHYREKMETAFNWFLGQNHLDQIIYNPCTGGCYDGLEETQVNMNQGAESTVSYLMARLAIEKSFNNQETELHSVGILKGGEKKQNLELVF
ncbi:MAG: glycosyltransferase [Phycisphaerae bacterium]|nr:glycosyltransferase [Saprospiraceae bacterium]